MRCKSCFDIGLIHRFTGRSCLSEQFVPGVFEHGHIGYRPYQIHAGSYERESM